MSERNELEKATAFHTLDALADVEQAVILAIAEHHGFDAKAIDESVIRTHDIIDTQARLALMRIHSFFISFNWDQVNPVEES